MRFSSQNLFSVLFFFPSLREVVIESEKISEVSKYKNKLKRGGFKIQHLVLVDTIERNTKDKLKNTHIPIY